VSTLGSSAVVLSEALEDLVGRSSLFQPLANEIEVTSSQACALQYTASLIVNAFTISGTGKEDDSFSRISNVSSGLQEYPDPLVVYWKLCLEVRTSQLLSHLLTSRYQLRDVMEHYQGGAKSCM
jgi:hypothetical protein